MRFRTLAIAVASLATLWSHTASAENGFNISVGSEYSTGDYGATSSTDIWYFPLTVKYETDLTTLKLTASYLKITGPGNVVGGADQPIQLGQNESARRTESGVGDTVATGSYNVYAGGGATGMLIDLTAKVKFATADEAKGLGTGENDYAGQIDVTKSFGAFSMFGSIGKKKMGDPPGINFDDPAYGSIGAVYKFSQNTNGGVVYDYRQRVLETASNISEATVFVSHKLTTAIKLQAYAIKGFSDGSPDWGAGLMLISTL